MYIFPAIDLYEGKAVRLFKGDYAQMTIYSDNPAEIAKDFASSGAKHLHLVDLEGAKFGTTPNLKTIERILAGSGLFTEVGGGIRSMEVVDTYLSAGVDRVILGTAAVNDPDFLHKAVGKYGEKIAVGVDIKDGMVAIKGWTEKSALDAFTFCHDLQKLGVWATRLYFTTENMREVDRVLCDYMDPGPFDPGACTRGLYLRGLD